MDRGRLRFKIGSLMAAVFVAAYLLYWEVPLIPLVREGWSRYGWPLALVPLVPIFVLALAFTVSRAMDRYVERVKAERESTPPAADPSRSRTDE